MPGNGANPVVKVPEFWRKDLPNGAKIIGTQNTEIPTVTISITIPGGHLLQANDLSKVGLAAYFADMMREDTKNYTAEQLAVELQKLGSFGECSEQYRWHYLLVTVVKEKPGCNAGPAAGAHVQSQVYRSSL